MIWPSIRRLEASTAGWAYYVKAPIVLPARTKLILAIPPEAQSLAAMQSHTRSKTFVHAVRFEACAENVRAYPRAYKGTVGHYTGFPFGFVLAHRSLCVPFEVWLDGRTEPITRLVPFGRRSCA